MNNTLFSRVELHFWDFAIRLLSQSGTTRAFLRKAYGLTQASEVTSLGILMGVSGFMGLLCGYLFYFLTLR